MPGMHRRIKLNQSLPDGVNIAFWVFNIGYGKMTNGYHYKYDISYNYIRKADYLCPETVKQGSIFIWYTAVEQEISFRTI